jgi:hypothetical protein
VRSGGEADSRGPSEDEENTRPPQSQEATCMPSLVTWAPADASVGRVGRESGLLASFDEVESAGPTRRRMKRPSLRNDAVFAPLLWTGNRCKTSKPPRFTKSGEEPGGPGHVCKAGLTSHICNENYDEGCRRAMSMPQRRDAKPSPASRPNCPACAFWRVVFTGKAWPWPSPRTGRPRWRT